MDKTKAFLTQKLNKDSFKDVDVKRSIKLTVCGALIIALMIQAIGCFCVPLTVSAAESDSIVGTWVIRSNASPMPEFTSGDIYAQRATAYFDFYIGDTLCDGLRSNASSSFSARNSGDVAWFTCSLPLTIVVISSTATNFNGGDCTSLLLSWLNSNADFVVDTVYDFTGETRIFNDELTLFNTSQATWTEAFGFNFEVLGVGTADYLHLSRDTRNWYTMSYSFDFEGSGGLTMIYRDTPPFDGGNGEWLGGKVNRKVITFLSNPEDPEFQQWLLDNTELYDDIDAAYQIGFNSGYNNGYEEGFSNKLIGDTLKGPIDALSALTIIEVQGVAITLGGVVMTAIALCLVLAFLKLYAGG